MKHVLSAFLKLRENHIQFIAASGNQYAKLKSIFGVRDMFFISENGAVIYKGINYIITVALIVKNFKMW